MMRFFYRLLGTLLVGIVISLWIIQSSSQVETFITKKLITLLEKEWNATITTKTARVNLFTTNLFLYNGKVIDNDHKHCTWTFEEAKIHVSPILYFLKKKIYLWITINNITATTKFINEEPDLIPHVKKMLASHQPPIPISIQFINLNNFDIKLDYKTTPIEILINGSFELIKDKTVKKKNQVFTASIKAQNISVLYNKKLLFDKSPATCTFYKIKHTDDIILSCQAQLNNLFFDHQTPYSINASWTPQKKIATLTSNTPKKTNISCLLQKNDLHIWGTISLETIINAWNCQQQKAPSLSIDENIAGACALDMNILNLFTKPQYIGTLTCNNLKYKNLFLKQLECRLEKATSSEITTNFTLTPFDDKKLEGFLHWNLQNNNGALFVTNSTSIKLSNQDATASPYFSWALKKNQFKLNLNINNTSVFDGTYTFALTQNFKEKPFKFDGQFTINNDTHSIITTGNTRKGNYRISCYLEPSPHITQWEYVINNEKVIDLSLANSSTQTLHGIIQFSLIRSFLSQSTKRLILGKNIFFEISLDQQNYTQLKGTLTAKGGKIYFPESRNLIEQFSTNFICEPCNKKIAFENFYINFCKGIISSPKVSLSFDHFGNIEMVHAPLKIENLFINWKRDFYGYIYGNLLINKLPESAFNFSGTIVLKKSFLRENIFSQNIAPMSFNSFYNFIPNNQKIKVNLRLLTEQPIKAKTDTLDALANIDLKINYAQGQDTDLAQLPHIIGSIKLENGHLKFLRNELNIEYGKIQFITNQMNDPQIDLIARNQINKYMITLQATGSLQKPTIILESNPELTEEQILGLLLAGSENAKLQTDLFAMLEQNLHNIILGSKNKIPKATTFLEKIAKPFKYIQITPDFTDQSGRGGIKGTVSVNVNDQVHAQIQKNFNTQEDFNAEVEYLLADEISLKGIKDQRGELGAEVELRLKL